MRELANTAARTAIDSHVRKRKGKQATGKLFGASATLVLSTVLGYWAWQLQSFDAGAGAGIGGVVGLYWCLSAVGRLFGLPPRGDAGGDCEHSQSNEVRLASPVPRREQVVIG